MGGIYYQIGQQIGAANRGTVPVFPCFVFGCLKKDSNRGTVPVFVPVFVPEKGNTMKYTNARFGFSVDYPQHWGEITESQNGDGAVLFQNDMMDVRAHADYSLLALNLSFDDYINEYYYGWERNNAVVLGADKAVKLIYHGEDSYQTALLAERDGVVYTFAVVRMKYYSPEQIDGSLETIITETETAEKTFKIL